MMHSFFSSPWRHNYFLSANTRISAETPRPSLPADLFTRPLPREVASYHILSSSKAQSPKDFSALVCRCVCISMTQDPGNVSASVQKKTGAKTLQSASPSTSFARHGVPVLHNRALLPFNKARDGKGAQLRTVQPPSCLRVLQTKAAVAVPAL
jgi:hypothetical protein